MKKSAVLASVCFLTSITTAAVDAAAAVESYDAYLAAPVRVAAHVGAQPPAFAAGLDEQSGVPSLLRAVPGGPHAPASLRGQWADAAQWYLGAYAAHYGYTLEQLDTAQVQVVRDLGHGPVVVVFSQRVRDVDVFGAKTSVLMDRSGALVAISGHLAPTGTQGGFAGAQHRAPGARRPVWFAMPDHLEAAWLIAPLDAAGLDTCETVVAADGRLLFRKPLAVDATYRVFADPTGARTPWDGPTADFTPHPTGTPDYTSPAFAPASMVTIDGFNLTETGTPDPWLAPGATSLDGNNAMSFGNVAPPVAATIDDVLPTPTSPNSFDFVYDSGLEANATPTQVAAGAVNAFYVVNWLHDWYYDAGFTEAAGNAQRTNYGRGGAENDPVVVATQDFLLGEANLTMAHGDGISPLLRLGVMAAVPMASFTTTLTAVPGAVPADFGPTSFSVTAPIVLGTDGAGLATDDACEALTGNVVGKIALVRRGSCSFARKAANVEAAGGVGVVIWSPGNTPFESTLAGDATVTTTITIPVVGILEWQADPLPTLLAAGQVSATLQGAVGRSRDMALDATVVAHEWGHILHQRLTSGTTAQYNAIGEGWGDFIALMLVNRPGDDPWGTFAIGGYSMGATIANGAYFGLRRYPYSTAYNHNPLMLKYIQSSAGNALGTPRSPWSGLSADNAEPHNAGEVWASLLWQAYAAFRGTPNTAAALDFDVAQRRMAEYVVAALMMTPKDATFTEARDALLAVVFADDAQAAYDMATGFAARGAGSCAWSPQRTSTDLEGVYQDFMVGGSAVVTSVAIDAAPESFTTTCDGDGILDAGEEARLLVTIANVGAGPLVGASVDVGTDWATNNWNLIEFPSGTFAPVPPVGGMSSTTVVFPVRLTQTLAEPYLVRFDAKVSDSGCGETFGGSLSLVNAETIPGTATHDSISPTGLGWLRDDPDSRFFIDAANGLDTVRFVGMDRPGIADARLVSPPITAGNGPLVVAFKQAYSFATSAAPGSGALENWDGAVIELSRDGLAWEDVSMYADPGYSGTISTAGSNPLKGRLGYVGESTGFSAFVTTTLDFGAALAGETFQLRFRMGTDKGTSQAGWIIDDVEVSGALTPPFTAIEPNVLSATYADTDGDGYGGGEAVYLCPIPAGNHATADDCGPSDPDMYPGAPERCNARDDDCDGQTDEDPTEPQTYYADADNDGYGAGAAITGCLPTTGAAAVDTDCDDADETSYPGAPETGEDGKDHNCDDVITPPPGEDVGPTQDVSTGDVSTGDVSTGDVSTEDVLEADVVEPDDTTAGDVVELDATGSDDVTDSDAAGSDTAESDASPSEDATVADVVGDAQSADVSPADDGGPTDDGSATADATETDTSSTTDTVGADATTGAEVSGSADTSPPATTDDAGSSGGCSSASGQSNLAALALAMALALGFRRRRV